MIKALFFDIDGTLLSFARHTIPSSTRQALEELRRQGYKLFIASGRHPLDVFSVLDLPFDGYVTLNGGGCLRGREEVVFRRTIDPADIERLIEWESGPEAFACVLAGDRRLTLNFVDERVTRVRELVRSDHLAGVVPFETWCEAAREGVLQLIAFFGPEQEERLMEELLPHCRAMRWSPLFADVVPEGVNKAEGIDRLLACFGIGADEAMAFGDGGNDLAMLRHVGLSVAMGNAAPEVKRAADYVTTSVDDHGIARALRHFGLIEWR